jgi:hypothetical protein
MQYCFTAREFIKMGDSKNKKGEKISVALKKDTIKLLDEVAKKKIAQAIKEGSFDIINLIRTKRGRGVSYDRQINFLAKIYLTVMSETIRTKDLTKKNPELKNVLDKLNKINHFFLIDEEKER